jgi:hypothetical protein
MSNEHDLNDAGEQRSFELIPANTVLPLQLNIRSGDAANDFLSKAANEASDGLDCEFVVADENSPYFKRKIFQRFTLHGTTPGHEQAGHISRNTLRAILESARGIRPDDCSEAAQKGRMVAGWGDLNGLRFLGRVGVKPAQNGYEAKNTLKEVITPERKEWSATAQAQQPAAAAPATSAPAPTPPPITKPAWARD